VQPGHAGRTSAESPGSVARRSWGPSWRQAGIPFGVAEGCEDPWLCGPGFRRVCLCRGMVEAELSRGTGTVKRPAQRGSVRVSSGHVRSRKQRARPPGSADRSQPEPIDM
jgi:hypothetical protein